MHLSSLYCSLPISAHTAGPPESREGGGLGMKEIEEKMRGESGEGE